MGSVEEIFARRALRYHPKLKRQTASHILPKIISEVADTVEDAENAGPKVVWIDTVMENIECKGPSQIQITNSVGVMADELKQVKGEMISQQMNPSSRINYKVEFFESST